MFASPFSEQLIRLTKKTAEARNALWFGAFVDTGVAYTEKEQELLSKNLALVQELGGEIITIADSDPVSGIIRLAKDNKVNLIVVGKSRRSFFYNFFHRGSLVKRLLEEAGDIELHVVATRALDKTDSISFNKFEKSKNENFLKDMVVVSVSVLILALIGNLILPFVQYKSIGLLFVLEVAILSLFVGRFGVYFAAIVAGFAWDYFFMPPKYTIAIKDSSDVILLLTFFIVAAITGQLTYRVRRQQILGENREKKVSALYHLARDLSSARSIDKILENAVEHIGKTFNADVVVLTKDSSEHLVSYSASTGSIDSKEISVADWVFKHRRPAGKFTDTFPSANFMYLPIATEGKTFGVLGLRPQFLGHFAPDVLSLAETFSKQLAIGLEREEMHELTKKGLLSEESERLMKSLLNSVSHELKTPLASIQGASSALLEPTLLKNEDVIKQLATQVHEGSIRLTRFVDALLNISRIEAGSPVMHLSSVDLKDLIQVVLRKLETELKSYIVATKIPDGMPTIDADFHLIEQVFTNLLRNIADHTNPGTKVEILGSFDGQIVTVVIKDNGPGIPENEIEHIFDKFYRCNQNKTGTTGLGLAIVKGFVESHKGHVSVKSRLGEGTQFTIKLPIGKIDE